MTGLRGVSYAITVLGQREALPRAQAEAESENTWIWWELGGAAALCSQSGIEEAVCPQRVDRPRVSINIDLGNANGVYTAEC